MLKSNLAKFSSNSLDKPISFWNQKQKTYPKILNLTLLSTIFITLFFVLIGLGYSSQWHATNNVNVPMHIQTMRAVSLFFIAWWCVCTIWQMSIGIKLYQEMQMKRLWYFILAFIPYLNIIGLALLIDNLSFKEYWNWFKGLFDPDYYLLKHYHRKSWRYIMMCVVLIVMSPEIVFIWIPQYETDPNYVYGLNINNLWFYSFQYFTIETNSFCIVFVICFVIYPQWKIFNNHTWLIWSIAYLMIVGITYNAFLLPNNIDMHADDWSKYKWTKTMWEHVVDPIFFCISGLILIFQPKIIRPKSWLRTIRFGMIIPSVYLFYVVFAPFVSYQTVYSWLTNANPNVLNAPGALLAHGEWYMIFLMLGYLLVFLGLITLIWYFDISSYHKYLRLQLKEKIVNAK